MVRVLGIIPARGQSKRLPRKNVRELCGKPMIAWSIEAATTSGVLDRVVISTDDEEIADAARAAGADVPFMRPAHLATDTAQSIDVVLDVIARVGEPQIIVLLQPTSPLRISADIIACVEKVQSGAPAALTVMKHEKPWPVYRHLDADQRLNLCPEPPVHPTHILTGSVYAVTTEVLKESRSFSPPGSVGVVVPWERSIDVDVEAEFRLCEFLMAAG